MASHRKVAPYNPVKTGRTQRIKVTNTPQLPINIIPEFFTWDPTKHAVSTVLEQLLMVVNVQ